MRKLFKAMGARLTQRQAKSLQAEYDHLNYLEAQQQINPEQLKRLDDLRPQFGVNLIRNAKGKVVGAIGTREGQLDRQIGDLIGKIMNGTITPAEHRRYDQYCDERVARMMPAAFIRLERILAASP